MLLAIRNIIFTLIHPGVVVGVIPYLVLNNSSQLTFEITATHHYIGILTITIGLVILFQCIFDFARLGKGTLSPADPTQKLVIKGLYRYSRNPMYVGVLLILLGEVIYMRSFDLFFYTIIVFIGFHLFIRYIEEPRLQRDFGAAYEEFKKKVKRWI